MQSQTRKTATYYSREDYKNKQLQKNKNSPHWGNSTCQLCEDGNYPLDLNKTVCCDATPPSGWKLPTVSMPGNMGAPLTVLAGVVVFGVCARKLISARRSRSKYDKRLPETIDLEAAATEYKRMKDRPGATSPSRKAYSPSRKQSRTKDRLATTSPLRMGYSPSRKSSKKNDRLATPSPSRKAYSPSRKQSRTKDGLTRTASPLRMGYSPTRQSSKKNKRTKDRPDAAHPSRKGYSPSRKPSSSKIEKKTSAPPRTQVV